MAKLKKASITKWKQRRDVFDISRFLLFMFLIYALMNGIIMLNPTEGSMIFLKYLNATVMIGILLLVFFLDTRRYNILNYGQLFVKRDNEK